jgi:hypothetical protein
MVMFAMRDEKVVLSLWFLLFRFGCCNGGDWFTWVG